MEAGAIALIAGVCFLGSLVQAACGFGFAVVVMGVLSALMPTFGEAAGLSNLLMLCVSAAFMLRLRGHIRWRVILWPLAAYLPVSFLMVRIVAADPNGLMQKLLGAGLVGLCVYMIFFQGRLHIRMTPVSGLITGALSGVLGGLFCMAGVPMAVYLLSVEEKEDYLATIQTFFAMVAVYSAVLHGASGFLTGRVFQAFLFSLAAVALGAAAGKRIFNRINRETLKKVVYGFMLVSGVFLLAS